MNIDRLIRMIVNMVTRRAVNAGIDKGIALATRGGKARGAAAEKGGAQARDARALAKRARQAAKITRRLDR